jgi:hypothetical protein
MEICASRVKVLLAQLQLCVLTFNQTVAYRNLNALWNWNIIPGSYLVPDLTACETHRILGYNVGLDDLFLITADA